MRLVSTLLLLSLGLAACNGSTPEARGVPAAAEDMVVALAREPDALLLDVRTAAEFASGHVEGAVNVPLDEAARMVEVIGRKDRPVILYCRSGRRSGQALDRLSAQGFTRLVNAGGYQEAATRLGKPVVQ